MATADLHGHKLGSGGISVIETTEENYEANKELYDNLDALVVSEDAEGEFTAKNIPYHDTDVEMALDELLSTKIKELWKNDAPSTAMDSAIDLTMNDSIRNYSLLIIDYRINTSSSRHKYEIMLTDSDSSISGMNGILLSTYNNATYSRGVSIKSDKVLNFGVCTPTGVMIPLRILGVNL